MNAAKIGERKRIQELTIFKKLKNVKLISKITIHKPLIIQLWLVFQLYFSWKGIETIPFFNYGMFSGKVNAEKPIQQFYFLDQYGNEKNIAQFGNCNPEIVKSQIKFYLENPTDSVYQKTYNWLIKISKHNAYEIGLKQYKLENNRLVLVNKTIIFNNL